MDERVKILEAKLASITNDEGQSIETVDLLNELAWQLKDTDIVRAVRVTERAGGLSRSISYRKGLAYSLRNEGYCNSLTAHYEASLSKLFEAVSLFEEEGDQEGKAVTLNFIGNVYMRLGDHASALDYSFRSLNICEDISDSWAKGQTLRNLGNIYSELGDHEKALDRYLSGLKLSQEVGDTRTQCSLLLNIGNNRSKFKGEHAEALKYYFEGLKIACDIGNNRIRGLLLVNIGYVYMELGDYVKAHEYSLEGLEIVRGIGDELSEGMVSNNLGMLFIKMGEPHKALEYLHKALATGEEIRSKEATYEAHQLLSQAYELGGELAEALKHYKAYHCIREEIYGADAERRIKGIIVQYETERSQKEAEIYRLQNVELAQAYSGLESLTQALQEANEQKSQLIPQLRQQAEELERQNREDSLTGLYNRRYLDFQLSHEFERARRFARSLTVVMVDIDFFKKINDQYSHRVGDEVLKAVAQIFKENCRTIDVIARYGGEEFVLLLAETPAAKAATLCEKIRGSIEGYDWQSIHPELKVTVSIGFSDDLAVANYEKLLSAADVKLYEAKRRGRNQVRY